ncbi:mast cell protease 3-like [Myxocyprinus asiaticus]|uniref:mast cell protease 3-like n=1 Tax=Myxocyprinus asiaticus TaxID=70543 RepID=UPI002221EFA8|nr:mast cell protease 3-like [Myxocyprinus asiaticus]
MTIISLLLLATLLPNLSFTARIVYGKEEQPHSRPYMVSLQYYGYHICGGFLISDEFVMTAAHCRPNNEILTAVVGAHDLTNWRENSVRIGVKSYHKHPFFFEDPVWNDIMLLRLEKGVKQDENVKWISIAKKEEKVNSSSVCSVAGWGRLSTTGPVSDRLMETDVKIMNSIECADRWGWKYSPSQMMCAYGDGGSCKGDSGGPLVCGDTAVGVTSFGSRFVCNSLQFPNVYTKISAFLPWIHSTMGNVE